MAKTLVSLLLATATWVGALGVWYRGRVDAVFDTTRVDERARRLVARQLQHLNAPTLRTTNPEWDFMTRSFVAWSLANLALRDATFRERAIDGLDRLIQQTLADEARHGQSYFLMAYGASMQRSLFVDSEVALSLGLRRLVRDDPAMARLHRQRTEQLERAFATTPLPASYPDEAWTFDASVALAAFRVSDALEGTDHRALVSRWLERARTQLVDPKTHLFNSSYHLDGAVRDGPEGSSLWLAIAMLELVDEPLAHEQYERARTELIHDIGPFALAREWPKHGGRAQTDIDSGVQLPLVEASPSSSGLALVAASAMHDEATLASLLASVEFAAFPLNEGDGLHYAAGNDLGDAVILYALSSGPAWARVKEKLQ